MLTWSADAIQNTGSNIQAQIKKSHQTECENSHLEIKNVSNLRKSRADQVYIRKAVKVYML